MAYAAVSVTRWLLFLVLSGVAPTWLPLIVTAAPEGSDVTLRSCELETKNEQPVVEIITLMARVKISVRMTAAREPAV